MVRAKELQRPGHREWLASRIEKESRGAVEALHRNREHPLDDGQCRRFPEGRKMEERTDGRKAGHCDSLSDVTVAADRHLH
jgi:hypothetical protein